MIRGVLSFIVACLLLIQCSAFQRVRVPYKLTRLRCDADKDIAAEVEADVVVSDTPLDPSVGSSPSSEVNATSAVVEDPMAAEIKAKEVELANVVARLEATLKDERLRLSSARDKLSETGKTGFFMVQAQVAEFMVCTHNIIKYVSFLLN